jgi:hypothetical protein
MPSKTRFRKTRIRRRKGFTLTYFMDRLTGELFAIYTAGAFR